MSGLRGAGKLTALEQQDGYLAQVEVDEVARLVGHVRSEVAANDAMPGRVVLLVELFLDECGDVLRNGNKFKLNYKFLVKEIVQGLAGADYYFHFQQKAAQTWFGEKKMKKTHHSNIHHRPHSNSLLAITLGLCVNRTRNENRSPLRRRQAGRQDVRL